MGPQPTSGWPCFIGQADLGPSSAEMAPRPGTGTLCPATHYSLWPQTSNTPEPGPPTSNGNSRTALQSC